jgi:hypothetical protein
LFSHAAKDAPRRTNVTSFEPVLDGGILELSGSQGGWRQVRQSFEAKATAPGKVGPAATFFRQRSNLETERGSVARTRAIFSKRHGPFRPTAAATAEFPVAWMAKNCYSFKA